MNYCKDNYRIGDLVCLKTHYTGEGGWFCLDAGVGIVLEIIQVDKGFIYHDKQFRCYDYIVFWCESGERETLPDLLIEKYDDFLRRLSGRERL